MPRSCTFKLELEFPQPLAGVDEAGCAPLAGPVVAGACILDREKFPRGIDDSKNLPIEKREAIYARLVKCSVWGVGIVSVEEIDQINIYWARMLAMTRAVEALGLEPAWVLVDGNACRNGSGHRKRSLTVMPNAVRSLRLRLSPRSLETASWPSTRTNIPATAGRRTADTVRPTTGGHFMRSDRRRFTGAASRRCVPPSTLFLRPISFSKPSSLSSHTHQRLSLRRIAGLNL